MTVGKRPDAGPAIQSPARKMLEPVVTSWWPCSQCSHEAPAKAGALASHPKTGGWRTHQGLWWPRKDLGHLALGASPCSVLPHCHRAGQARGQGRAVGARGNQCAPFPPAERSDLGKEHSPTPNLLPLISAICMKREGGKLQKPLLIQVKQEAGPRRPQGAMETSISHSRLQDLTAVSPLHSHCS